MTGEILLEALLREMNPVLQDGEYVFCSVEPAKASELSLTPIGQFIEKEGLTIIVEKTDALANRLEFSYLSKMITLEIHSSLNAIGFLAAITEKLAAKGVSVNVVSSYFHDHLFVPVHRAGEAMTILNTLSETASNQEKYHERKILP